MDSTESKQVWAKRILLMTGLFPTIPCWIVYLSGVKLEKESLSITFWLLVATVLTAVITHPFRKKKFSWIYNKRPVYGSFLSIGVHMLAGYVSLAGMFSSYFLVMGDYSSALSCLVYALFAMGISLPGAIIGFYVNAHAFVYLAHDSFILKSDENKN